MIKLFYARHAYSLGIGEGLLRARLVRLRPAGLLARDMDFR
jgi:hypothetical protein